MNAVMQWISQSILHKPWLRCAAAVVAAAGLTHGVLASAQRTLSLSAGTFYLLHTGSSSPGSGHASQSYLGVDIRDVSDDAATSARKASQPRGAEILHVDHDGPAGKAGLHEHDIVLVINGQAVEGGEPLRRILRETPPGHSVSLVISRGGHEQTISAQMANREDVERAAREQYSPVVDPQPTAAAPVPQSDDRTLRRGNGFFSARSRASRNFIGGIVLSPGYTGAMLETMEPQLAEYFGSQDKNGLLVRSVDANSPAAISGMRAGDVVVRVNSTVIASSSDWLRTVRENKGKSMNVVVLRDRHEQVLTMTPNAKHHSGLIPGMWPFGNSIRPAAQAASAPQQASVSPWTFSMM